jgi:hypothetical protein
MRWTTLLCIGAAMLLTACGWTARYPSFTAKEYRLAGQRQLPGTDLAGSSVFYREGDQLRYEGPLEDFGLATVIYDPARNLAFLLQASAPPRPLFAGETQRLAMPLSEAQTPQPLETAWEALGADNARSIGPCRFAGQRGTFWRPRKPIAPDVVRTACITPDGIVLQLIENETVLFEATSLTRGRQAASLFQIPETYRVIDNAELAHSEDEPVDAERINLSPAG